MCCLDMQNKYSEALPLCVCVCVCARALVCVRACVRVSESV